MAEAFKAYFKVPIHQILKQKDLWLCLNGSASEMGDFGGAPIV